MEIVGGNPDARAVGVSPLSGTVNYFIGNDPSQWHANIPTFGRVANQDVYPGIDLVYYGNQGQLEYDFIVAPGADPSQIALNFAGADGIEIKPHGDLVVHTAAGDLLQQKPYLYQEVDGVRQEVAGEFRIKSPDCSGATDYCLPSTVVFEVGAYDPSRALVIDPLVLGYSTYLGSNFGGESGSGIGVDAAGNAYATGLTSSTDFPTTPGAFDTNHNGGPSDAFVAKLSPDGASLVYATYLGGSAGDSGYGIAVDAAGNAYVTGNTDSTDFPTTPGAFDASYNGNEDAFVAKLSPAGNSLVYGTYLGGSTDDSGTAIAVDASGNAYVTGYTRSINFPTTGGSFDISFNRHADGFVAKLNPAGSGLVYGTYMGGSDSDIGYSIGLDAEGNAYAAGITRSTDFPTTPGAFDTSHNGSLDGFLAKLNAAGSGLVYGTYMGGSILDFCRELALDAAGNVYVNGYTLSTDFPTTPGAFDTSHNGNTDAFVAKLSPAGNSLVYGTFLGGSDDDFGSGIAVDAAGNAYVTGSTDSTNFPTTPGAFDASYNRGGDAFMTKVNAAGSNLVYGTFLGGSKQDSGSGIAVDAAGNPYLTGRTLSTNFPTTPEALKRRNRFSNAFLTTFAEV